MYEQEIQLTCPYCWQHITMLLDPSHGSQSYIEDCEVCCKPIQVSYTIKGELIETVTADRCS